MDQSSYAAGYSDIWRLSRPRSGVKNQSGNNTNRPLIWEDQTPEEPRFRRVEQAAPRVGRVLPGMPLEFEDPDADDDLRPRKRFSNFDEPGSPWWRPGTTVGRVFLALAAFVALGSLTASGVLLKIHLQHDARFRIAGTSNIQAIGLTEVSRSQMLPVFGEDIGRNIFFVPLNERRKQLESVPWIQHATIMRILPDQVRVSVVERQPVAFTREGTQIELVDPNGVLLPMSAASMAHHHYSFPVVTGIDGRDPADARKARMAVYLRMMADLDSSGKHYSDQVSEIDLTDPEDARVTMPEQGADILAHFGQDHFLDRFQRYQAHIAEWRQQYPKLSAVDLRYDQQVVLRMASGAQDALADPGAKASSTPASVDGAVSSVPKLSAGQLDAGASQAAELKAAPEIALAKQSSTRSAANGHAASSPAAKKIKPIQNRPAQNEKKHADVKRAALNAGRRKPASKTPQAAAGSHLAPVMAQGG
jgi:cell division protein FtsQ